MTLYMEITRDEYELPVAVADSPGELSRMRGLDRNTVAGALMKARKSQSPFCKYIKVEVEDD